MTTVIDAKHTGPKKVLIRDILQPMTDAQLKTMWEEKITETTDFALRDSLLDVMLRRGVRPETWIHRRDMEYGLYPDTDDPDFASRLLRKTEFAQLRSEASAEDTCTKSQTKFDTTPVQRLVARFLNPMTPYLGLLLDHGVGVGKTCSAITVAETFLDVSPYNTVYILAPQAIADGFRKTIFDPSKLIPTTKEERRMTGEMWKSSQCTGMTYPRLAGMADSDSREELAKEVNKLVKKRYKIVGYLAFANWVKAKLDDIPAVITGAARKDKENQILMALFSDHLLIIDEAHNLRDMDESVADDTTVGDMTDAAEGKRLTPILKSILAVAEGLRLMLMTATPMYNTAPEILFLLNLLILNDTKVESKLKQREIFTADGQFADGGEALLTAQVRRYVSYMRGENPNTFPLRLTPPEHAGERFMAEYPVLSISRKEDEVHLTDMDKQIMGRLPLIVHEIDETVAGAKVHSILDKHRNPPENGGAIDVTDFILDQTMQAGNITYPGDAFGTRGWEANMKSETHTVGGQKVKQLVWTGRDTTMESVFGKEGIRQHAPKISAIIDSITKAEGMSFVYSRYVLAGALPICVALELQGWCRILADGTPAPLLKRTAAGKPKHFYILLTSDDSLSPNFKGLLQYATTFASPEQARLGTKVKAIIGSQVASEGLDLKCIREIHLLDGWYHLNRTEQIIGRGVRYCSHVLLPPELRNTLIYLHAVSVRDYESADLYAYRLAVRKSQPIGRVSRLMKINAWDCMLNKDAILLADMPPRKIKDAQKREDPVYDVQDKPFTSFCDFMEDCEYVCGSRSLPEVNVGSNRSTYTEDDFRRLFLEKEQRLQDIFSSETAFPLKDVRTMVYHDIPWSIGAVGLREALGRLKIKRADGIYGTLILLNNYVVFQPEGVTDTQIPLAFRYGRAYGRLPRTIVPQRSRVLETNIPIVDKAPVRVIVDASEDILRTSALASLREWHAIVQRIIAEPSGKIVPPAGIPVDKFNGWRWVIHHFASLPETIPIACQWWMDNLWNWKQREAVFRDWSSRGIATLNVEESMFASLFQPRELFQGRLSGYLVFDTDALELRTYCHLKGKAPEACTAVFRGDVDAVIGPAIDRKADTGDIFGFLVSNEGNVVFKSVDVEKGSLRGAECANTSNLYHHVARIILAQRGLRKVAGTAILPLLLPDTPETASSDAVHNARREYVKARFEKTIAVLDPTMDTQHTSDLSLNQCCPYLEFLLRWMQVKRLGGKHWFLSIVESTRAGVKFK
jgi:hypothetical protein